MKTSVLGMGSSEMGNKGRREEERGFWDGKENRYGLSYVEVGR